jgi:hypothetical protein
MLGLPNRSFACSINYSSSQISLPQYAHEVVEVIGRGQGTTVTTNDRKNIDNKNNTPDNITES